MEKAMEQLVAVAKVTFEDGCIEAQELARGSREECIAALDATPGIACSAGKPIRDSRAGLMPAVDWDNAPVRWRW
jgi:hypothetical protein